MQKYIYKYLTLCAFAISLLCFVYIYIDDQVLTQKNAVQMGFNLGSYANMTITGSGRSTFFHDFNFEIYNERKM